MKLIYNPRIGNYSIDSLKSHFRNLRNFSSILLTAMVIAFANVQNVNAQYCASNATSTSDEVITNVSIGSMNNSSVCGVAAPGAGSLANQYANYTTSVAAPNLTAGVSYPMTFAGGTCGGYYGAITTVYIDWNGDFDFLDAGESVYTSGSLNAATTFSFNVAVPVAAVPGLKRMRLVMVEGTPSSCGTYIWGETEDYNVNIVASSACSGTPTGGSAITSNATPCPSIAYTISLSGASTSSGLTYQWQSSANNTTFTNIAGATSSFYNTTATTSMYYRCIITCTASTLTATSTSVQVTVSTFINCYCASNATSTADEEILNVTLGSLNNSSSCGTTGGPGSISGQYSNYTNASPAVAIPNLTQGFVYPLSLGIGTCGGNYSNMTKVWIDYNQNGMFTDPGEQVWVSPTVIPGAHTEGGNITIPLTAIPGNTRMRVVTVETSAATGVNPCGTYTWGETEDYFVNIAVPLANDAGVSAFVNPVIPTCSFNDTVSVTITNYGTDTLTSASINWKLNTTIQTPVFWTGSIPPLGSLTVYVGVVSYGAGDNLYAWTSNPNGVIENPSGSYNDTSSIIGLLTGLSGVYTVGGTAPDFPTILSAIAALNFAGVCGPTVFDIRTGTYFDQFALTNVIGMNATNTVTFRSEDGHRDSVTFDYAASGAADNYVVSLNNADYFHFEKITFRNSGASFGYVFNISGGSDYNTVDDCAIISQSTAFASSPVYSSGANDNYNTFNGNKMEGGYYGAYWYGSGISSLEIGNVFSNNEFLNNYYYGAYFAYQDGVTATHNRLHGVAANTNRYGLYFNYCDKGSVITHNSIESNATSHFTYPFYLWYCDATSTARGLIANNMITAGNTSYTGTNYGMYIYFSGFFDIYNNSVHIVNGSTSSRALYLYQGGANNVKNNTFTNFGTGYAAYVVGTYGINEMDYNNLFTNGTVLAYFDVANTNTFANWQTVSGYDANGVNVDPGYYSDFDLHVCADSLNNAGTPLALVTDDIDGQPRNASTPDIGADEFSPLSQPGFVGPDVVVCTGQTVNLWAGGPSDDVLWSTNDSTNLLVVTTPGTYTVSVIGSCGISFDTVVVTASALTYTNFLNASATTFCSGGSALLTSTYAANTYSWTGGSTNDSLTVTTSGNYTLNIVDACGTGTQTVAITVNTVPVASFTTVNSFMTGAFTNTSTGGGTQTYVWNFGDGTPTSTAMSPSHIYTTIGTFTVTLTVTNACGSNTTTSTITTSNIGLEEVAGLGSIAVYPNPSNGLFQIDFNMNNDSNIDIQVTNVLGEEVYVKSLGSINGTHKDAIDITNAAPGVYYVTIISNNEKVMTSKLVKQ